MSRPRTAQSSGIRWSIPWYLVSAKLLERVLCLVTMKYCYNVIILPVLVIYLWR